jgi:hypothetical protein
MKVTPSETLQLQIFAMIVVAGTTALLETMLLGDG